MALSKIQLTVLKALKDSPLQKRFYWTGGTLLSERYLQHRYSSDIDLFSDTPFRYEEVLPLAKAIQQQFKIKKLEEKKVHDRWEFFLHNHQEVRFEFVHYNFPALRKRQSWQGVLIDSLEDILANKVMAAVERREPKDVVDLYFLTTKKKFTLDKAISLFYKKFKVEITKSTLLAEIISTCRLLESVQPMLYGGADQRSRLIKQIKQHFEALSARLIHRQWD